MVLVVAGTVVIELKERVLMAVTGRWLGGGVGGEREGFGGGGDCCD